MKALILLSLANIATTVPVKHLQGLTAGWDLNRTTTTLDAPHLLYRCYLASGDHFTSTASNCEGTGAVMDQVLGCTASTGTPLTRCFGGHKGQDHMDVTASCPPPYHPEGVIGYLRAAAAPGDHVLMRCINGQWDHFDSIDSNCEGQHIDGPLGYLSKSCGPPPKTDWPSFSSQQSLQASPWGKYFTSLYGELPNTYPVDLSQFWCFYIDKMTAAGTNPPASVGTCPTSVNAPEGERYDENNAYSSKDLTWLWHSLSDPVYQGFADNTVVEVTHHKDPFGDEHHGMWFLYAKGSGVFLNIGKTKIFPDHPQAGTFFNCPGCSNEKVCQAAAAAGYDSIQFNQHRDGTNYPCAAGIGASWMNIEIVAVKLVGTYPCGQAQGTAAALRAGWNGDKACKCDPKNPNTNCVFS